MTAELLDDPDSRIRLAAAQALLDRGFGKAVQPMTGDDSMSPGMLHLLAIREIGKELLAERAAAMVPTIQHETNGHSYNGNLIDAPPPLE